MHSFLPKKQAEIYREVENSLDDFWKIQLNKERSKGKIFKILRATLEKRREIGKGWQQKCMIFYFYK